MTDETIDALESLKDRLEEAVSAASEPALSKVRGMDGIRRHVKEAASLVERIVTDQRETGE
jgi:hypothetical protein